MSENKSIAVEKTARARRLAAYRWASVDMEVHAPKEIDHFKIVNLKGRADKPNTHVSLFRGEANNPVILRVWWNDTNSVKYSIVDNYNELRAESVDLTEQLERNALFVFDHEMKAIQAVS